MSADTRPLINTEINQGNTDSKTSRKLARLKATGLALLTLLSVASMCNPEIQATSTAPTKPPATATLEPTLSPTDKPETPESRGGVASPNITETEKVQNAWKELVIGSERLKSILASMIERGAIIEIPTTTNIESSKYVEFRSFLQYSTWTVHNPNINGRDVHYNLNSKGELIVTPLSVEQTQAGIKITPAFDKEYNRIRVAQSPDNYKILGIVNEETGELNMLKEPPYSILNTDYPAITTYPNILMLDANTLRGMVPAKEPTPPTAPIETPTLPASPLPTPEPSPTLPATAEAVNTQELHQITNDWLDGKIKIADSDLLSGFPLGIRTGTFENAQTENKSYPGNNFQAIKLADYSVEGVPVTRLGLQSKNKEFYAVDLVNSANQPGLITVIGRYNLKAIPIDINQFTKKTYFSSAEATTALSLIKEKTPVWITLILNPEKSKVADSRYQPTTDSLEGQGPNVIDLAASIQRLTLGKVTVASENQRLILEQKNHDNPATSPDEIPFLITKNNIKTLDHLPKDEKGNITWPIFTALGYYPGN